MVDFTTRKRHFGVVGYFGAFSEPLERKKDKTKCSYKIYTLLHHSEFKMSTNYLLFFLFPKKIPCVFLFEFAIVRANFDEKFS